MLPVVAASWRRRGRGERSRGHIPSRLDLQEPAARTCRGITRKDEKFQSFRRRQWIPHLFLNPFALVFRTTDLEGTQSALFPLRLAPAAEWSSCRGFQLQRAPAPNGTSSRALGDHSTEPEWKFAYPRSSSTWMQSLLASTAAPHAGLQEQKYDEVRTHWRRNEG